MSLQLKIRVLDKGDVKLKGELPLAELKLETADELIHPRKALRYDLTAQKVGENVLVQGRLELGLRCECARCLKPFDYMLKLDPWTAHLPLKGSEDVVVKDDGIDLTPLIREDILLEFPQHPLCKSDCAGLPNRPGKNAKEKSAGPTPNPSAWSELNKLKF